MPRDIVDAYTLREKLSAGRFVLTVEFTPPRGADVARALGQIVQVRELYDAVNVTDCSGARLRMNSISFSSLVQRLLGIETIFHYTCRDRNILALQADLMGAWALGVRNILTLGGDDPAKGDHPQAKGVFDVDTIGLLRLVARLNQGADWNGNAVEGATDLFIGAAANPASPDLEREIARMADKAEAGAQFFQTQPVFDLALLEAFHARACKLGRPIIYGVLPLPREKSAHFLQKMGVHVPDTVIERVRRGGRDAGLALAHEAAQVIAACGQGLHVYPWGEDLEAVSSLARALHPGPSYRQYRALG